MKAIVMNQAVPGATEGFRRVREMRPDILLLGGVPQEDPLVIGKVADLIMRNDFVSAGYRVIWASKQLGAKTFVHISFPRHMSVETLTRRRMIFEQACNDLGVKFVFETAPDPLSPTLAWSAPSSSCSRTCPSGSRSTARTPPSTPPMTPTPSP
jgi:hypothetical protein